MSIRRIAGVLILVLMIAATGDVISQNKRVDWSSFNQGYAEARTSGYVLRSVAGQPIVGTSVQGNTQVISGFLADTLFSSVLVAVNEEKGLPTSFALSQNYPNPFNPSTTVRFDVSQTSFVTVKVYDILGREVETIVSREMIPGKYTITWNAYQMPSGVYFYRMTAGDFVSQKKMLLMK
jgi:hypothetical protein